MLPILRLLLAAVRFSISVLRIALPFVIGLLRFALGLMGIAIASLWTGVPNATQQIADDWLARAIFGGLPVQWSEHLYPAFRVMAFLIILAGLVLLAQVTVFLVRLVF
jgi:hypothetical protein